MPSLLRVAGVASAALTLLSPLAAGGERVDVSLNGRWEIAESTSGDAVPASFTATIPVPGLIDMASPTFVETGGRSVRRNFYWYRRTFAVPRPAPAVVRLKINKACYGTRVYVNGSALAENPYCFTPTLLDIRRFLRTDDRPNELVVRVGADDSALPAAVPNGRDVEKSTYLAGIYDDVGLIFTGYPLIENVQIVPDLVRAQIRVVAEVASMGRQENFRLQYKVTETKGDRMVQAGQAEPTALVEGRNTVDFTVPIPDGRRWSPADPFLYRLALSTGGDSLSQRFGLRTFRFDKDRKVALLNGQPHALLGTNVCIFRFFEDAARGGLPWDEAWVRQLHLRFRSMNWTAVRYCIGFPPEKWYDIADELGFLVQDEFPIWGGHQELPFSVDAIAEEYTRWLRERWNHPCVVIWDAQNESVSVKTGEALNRVRHSDLSHRPWDNGWSPPQRDDDCIEAHPYRFNRFNGTEARHRPSERGFAYDLFHDVNDRPNNSPNTKDADPARRWKFAHPVIINEYDWLWLNRDGSTTRLTDNVYRNLFGGDLPVFVRRLRHAENVALLTEYWRCRRQAAGILHFCGLGYSRPQEPKGHTSDDFIDIAKLVFEPHFERLVKARFAPVCLMIHAWENRYDAGAKRKIPVYAINDSEHPWEGEIRLTLNHDRAGTTVLRQPVRIESAGQTIVEFDLAMPATAGDCRLRAETTYGGTAIESVRRFHLVAPAGLAPTVRVREGRAPTFADVPYGEHPRQALDFYQAKTPAPAPVAFHIHGGGWTGQDKFPVGDLERFLEAGVSVASINYRLIHEAMLAGVKPPVAAPMRDAARALQFVRSQAAEWNLDPRRIVAYGSSAGACTALWLALHDDLADPANPDPVARQSTRLRAVAGDGPQTTLDPREIRASTPNARYGGHAFGFMDPRDLWTRSLFFEEFLAACEQILPWIEEYSPLAHVSADDPPVFVYYAEPPALGRPQKDPVHAANFGALLAERLRRVRVPCEFVYPESNHITPRRAVDFVLAQLRAKP